MGHEATNTFILAFQYYVYCYVSGTILNEVKGISSER
jgi:hypothetical protein